MPRKRATRRAALMVLGVSTAAALATGTPAAASTPTLAPSSAAPSSAAVPSSAATPTVAVPADLTATIRLSNCSASLVRFPGSLDTDRAMMLSNGHCWEGGFPSAGEVLVNRFSSRTGSLLNAAGNVVGTVRADRLLYATMTDTDVSLYRLTQTFAAIRSATGITARTIAGQHPVAEPSFVPSGFFAEVFPCSVVGFVPTLREDEWTWHDSLKYDLGCHIIHGTSGSPIVSIATGQVIGVNNTNNDNGQRCTLNNPCEVNPDGTVFVRQGQGYGQQTYWFTTCLTPSRTIDLDRPGCLLPGGNPTPPPPPPPVLTVNDPGDQTGTVDVATSLTLTASGTSGPTTWSAAGLPTGLAIGAGSGVISGTPTTAGTSTVTVTATSGGQSDSATFSWTINPPGGPGPGGCGGVPAWDPAQAYAPGDQVSFDGHRWDATWWSTGAQPGAPTSWAVWSDAGPC